MATTTVARIPVRPEQARQLIVGLRIAIGSAFWLAPRRTCQVLGVDADDNPALPFLVRLFGSRDVAMGAALADAKGAARARQLRWGMVVDATDGLAALAGAARGYLRPRGAALMVAGVLAAVALGTIAQDD